MNKDHVIGIDISKQSFDVVDSHEKHQIYTQDLEGFKKFCKAIPKDSICVMEATGIYHLQLANYLFQNNIQVAVINPLRIKRFIQMRLRRNKTDKSDASMIRLYGINQDIDLYKPIDSNLQKSKDNYQTMEQFINIRASLKNKLKELQYKGSDTKLIQIVESQLVTLTESINELDAEITKLLNKNHGPLLSNLKSVVGIGPRTAAILIISSDAFKQFDSAKQLASYYGIAPSERSSGTSLRKKSHISKRGNPLVRKKLYMCSLQAARYNPACLELYQRLIAKGKPKKLALIAVANKLLRIAFAIAKSNIPYDREYRSYRKSA